MKARFLMYTADINDFAARMRLEGIGTQVEVDPDPLGHVSAVLDGWEVIWLARHYPAHTLAPEGHQGRIPGELEYKPPLPAPAQDGGYVAPGDGDVPPTREEELAEEAMAELAHEELAFAEYQTREEVIS